MSQDYYQILGVSKTASAADLKKAYHKLAKQYHPDNAAAEDTNAEKKFKEINAAYDVLKDEQKRAAYDRFGHDAFQNQQSRRAAAGGTSSFHPDINDIFGDFFGDFMGGGRRSRPISSKVRGSDLKYDLTINLEAAFHGIEKNISFSSKVKCDACHGSGSEKGETVTTCDACGGVGATRIQQGFFTIEQTCHKCQGNGQIIKNPCKKCHGMGRYHKQRNLSVNIPAGVENGTRIRHTGEGEAGIRGGNSGDLYVDISIKPHDIYKVDGANLHCKLPISFVNAALGGEVEVPVIEGGKVNLIIPAGTQNGDQLRLHSKGMSKMRSTIRGDMLTHIHVEVPKNLSKRQRELLEEFKKESISEKENDGSFFNKMKSLWS
ncbi:MAG: molecular chaperone DnaJ [Rickettsia endosymbiont of Ixodes persulcatus]|nr:molecular chaperone DnaJ [Rickettsia endosymbiont of Ixodes persulcatus]MCZ6901439.1 molecular chaperone DnaJ [Rickettsia endosymbiont of Ixodes persulcatus]MCZ6908626.1 molecular chaperone DnaJ [Rickettsia endosymbiont of Ixodes persulcatus]MCZ6910722.1 molecular chaperone DnaJ [Rickettsia endosymbiont of Ixodes persulcatus]MCZ6913140.1 molecular chaperone DnaJ [Rickettsia endosymbiont of Ixodes persulcatus]